MNRPKKSLGQHFLRCSWVIEALLGAHPLTKNDTVLEIGPGTGALTRSLALHAGQVFAVEKDEALASSLKKSLAKEGIGNVDIITGDVLSLLQTPKERRTILANGTAHVIANIPYYLTGRLLRTLLEDTPRPSNAVLTIQKEVADRILAKPPRMNLLATAVQAFATPQRIANIPKECFSPPPNVASAVIAITGISDAKFTACHITPDNFFAVVRRAYSTRRKTLANTLAIFAKDKRALIEVLAALRIDPKRRPETLSLEEWFLLANALAPSP